MEFGVLGLDGFQSSENAAASLSFDAESSKHKWGAAAARSGGVKQEGSGFSADDWRSSKVAKNDADYSPASASTALMLQSVRNLPLNPVSGGVSEANMLSFSSCSKSDTPTLPYLQQMAPRNTGYYSGALSSSSGMYLLNGVRGPFTPSQWLELEQQALIYKYMTANEPIPAHLLIPIKKALESAGLFGFNAATLRPTPWGWGPFHFGYSNSTDPEPGRCRRTDGKKWRCSRDAMPDQKYCERHMNRGRHRSRKHVEGQANGHSVSGATKSTTTTKHTPPPGAGLSNSFDVTHHYDQAKSLQQSASNPSMNPLLNRMLVNRENSCQGLQDTSQLSFLSLSGSNVNLNCSESAYSVPKHRNSHEESSPSNFADSSAGSPLFTITTSQKNSAFCSRADGSGILWPGLQSPLDTTQLSMSSIPMGSADYRLSHQHLEMGLGVGAQSHNNRQSSWIPSSWEPSMGGPLGEALQSGNGDGKKTSALNLLPKGWDGMGGYQLSSSSPTGVLQKSALVSLSNSSAGSSPRADNSRTIESGASLCNDLLGSTTLAHSSTLPALD